MSETRKQIMRELACPSAEFTPIPFWFFNDAPDRDAIKVMLADFTEKGVNGFVLHPRIGIPESLPYLSEAYFDTVTFIVRTAAELSMSIVLYDEGMYPSGSAHGLVVKSNPEFASTGIILTDDPSEGRILASYEDGRYLVSRYSGGTIRGIHFGEDDREAGAPPSADILNPAAVDWFIELTHESYYAHLKEYFGNTIIGFFTDEPCVLGRNTGKFRDWTDGFETILEAAGGDVRELRALFEKKDPKETAEKTKEESKTVRLYKTLIKQRLNEVYYRKLSDWCAAHGIALMGHPQHSDDIDEEQYFHVPGQDLIFRMVSPERGGITGMDSVQAKCSADMARHFGRRRNSNECFGVCIRDKIPWYMTAGDMKWFIDWLGIRGVNLFIPHAFFYSVEGRRKDERPPDAGPHNIWWEYYKLFSDYMKRISWLMTDSRNTARVAVFCKSGDMPHEELKPFYENQIEFNYLPVSLLPKCRAENGKLCVKVKREGAETNEYRYDYIINLQKLPLDPSIRCIHGIEEISEEDLDFRTESPCPNLRVTHLIKYGESMYFIHNEGNAAIDTDVSVPADNDVVPVVVDLWNFTCYRAECSQSEKTATVSTQKKAETPCNADSRIHFRLALKPFETALILFDRDDSLKAPQKPVRTDITKRCGAFALISEDRELYIKEYSTFYEADGVTGAESIAVIGEEMVECWCNGQFAGVSFWNVHEFSLGSLLRAGKNEIRIRFTGNAANRYSGKCVAYGLNESN